MKIKFLLPFLLLLSCISAHAQISVTVQSGVGQTFVEEGVNFNNYPDYFLNSEATSISSYDRANSELFAVYMAYPISEKLKLQVGIEAIRAVLISYHIMREGPHELNYNFRADNNRGIEIGTTSFPINLTYEEFLWRDKLFTSLKAGFSLSYPFRSRIFGNSFYPEIAYGAHYEDSSNFNFVFSRKDYGRREKVILFNAGVSAGWKFNDRLTLESGIHYRHGFVPILAVETSLFTDVEISHPDNNSSFLIEYIGRETYNNQKPTDRHAFTTNGSALFGTLALTYTFAKKDNEK